MYKYRPFADGTVCIMCNVIVSFVGRGLRTFTKPICSGISLSTSANFPRSAKNSKRKIPETSLQVGRSNTSLKVAIVGIPNVGKSTFFNALTRSHVAAENFPFCTIDPNESRVPVPDERFDFLCQHHKPTRKVPAFLNLVDVAGLVEGASEGAGLGNAFLSHISACDAIFHLVRAFDDEDIIHVDGNIDPIRDLQTILNELRIKDVEYFKARSIRVGKKYVHSDRKEIEEELTIVTKVLKVLEEDKKQLRFIKDWNSSEVEVLNRHLPLTAKPMVYLINLSEINFVRGKNGWLTKIKMWIDENDPGALVIPFSGTFEAKAVSMDEDEFKCYSEEVKAQSVLPDVIKAGFNVLQLQSFFTTGKDEVKAWTIKKGTKAPEAAGKIHTDFEKRFIIAEVMKFDDFKECGGSKNAVKAAGKYYQKGKHYVVCDGDIVFFKFNASKGKKK